MSGEIITKKLFRQCPICGNTYGTVLHTIKIGLPESVDLPSEYDVVCCDKCGFACADVDASQEKYNLYYDHFNMYSQDPVLKAKLIGNREMVLCRILTKYADHSARILDVGCGAGGLLQCLRREGFFDICGIDPSVYSIEILKENGINGQVLNVFDDIPEEMKGAFDVVLFTAVLEHIYDLNLCVKQLERYLKDNGILYIVVPAVENMGKVYSKIPDNFNHEHINYFSLVSLDNLFRKHGFTRENPDDECIGPSEEEKTRIIAIYKKSSKEQKTIKDEISKKAIQTYLEEAIERERNEYGGVRNFLLEQ